MKAMGGNPRKKRREKNNESTQIKKRKEKKRQKIAAGHYAYQTILLCFLKEQALPFLWCPTPQPSNPMHQTEHNNATKRQMNGQNNEDQTCRCNYSRKTQPTTLRKLNASRNPPRSSFCTSTTQCSKLSIRTRALVSCTTSWKAMPNRFRRRCLLAR